MDAGQQHHLRQHRQKEHHAETKYLRGYLEAKKKEDIKLEEKEKKTKRKDLLWLSS